MSKGIFETSDGLVDLPALFEHLVSQVGSRQVLDPHSRVDGLWSLIEAKTMDKDYVRAASMTQHNKLEGRSVAKYLGYHFGQANSFDMAFRTALRL